MLYSTHTILKLNQKDKVLYIYFEMYVGLTYNFYLQYRTKESFGYFTEIISTDNFKKYVHSFNLPLYTIYLIILEDILKLNPFKADTSEIIYKSGYNMPDKLSQPYPYTSIFTHHNTNIF